jgi:DNA invertase Pin-like site-specific DNA recombinase
VADERGVPARCAPLHRYLHPRQHRRASRQRPRPRRPRGTRSARRRDRRGWELVDVIRDAGRTGANLKRPGIRKALQAIARGQADGLVVAKLDRVSRSSTDTALLIDWFTNEARADFVALDVEFADTTSPMGKLMVGLFAHSPSGNARMTAQRTAPRCARSRRKARPTARRCQ